MSTVAIPEPLMSSMMTQELNSNNSDNQVEIVTETYDGQLEMLIDQEAVNFEEVESE